MSRYNDNRIIRNMAGAAIMQRANIINNQKKDKAMAYERKDGDIRISPNTYKNNDRQPDMRGTALIGGKEYRISLWRRENERGEWWSGSIEEAPATQGTAATRAAYVQERAAVETANSDKNRDADTDDLPF